MILKYHWENVTVNRECDFGGNTVSPHTIPRTEDVDYKYEVSVDCKDVLAYLGGCHKDTVPAQMKVFELLDDCDAINYEALESNEDFVDYMHRRYERIAWERFEEENGAY